MGRHYRLCEASRDCPALPRPAAERAPRSQKRDATRRDAARLELDLYPETGGAEIALADKLPIDDDERPQQMCRGEFVINLY